jgi:hypothetical protein
VLVCIGLKTWVGGAIPPPAPNVDGSTGTGPMVGLGQLPWCEGPGGVFTPIYVVPPDVPMNTKKTKINRLDNPNLT